MLVKHKGLVAELLERLNEMPIFLDAFGDTVALCL